MSSPILRGIAGVLGGSLILAAVAIGTASPPSFELIALPELAGASSYASGVSLTPLDVVFVSGWSRTAGGVQRAVVWREAAEDSFVLTTLPVPNPAGHSRANSIDVTEHPNTSVNVAGAAVDDQNLKKPVLWEGSGSGVWSCTVLPTLAGMEGEVFGCATGDPVSPALAGWALGSAGQQAGVVWLEDSTGTWGIRGLPHYAPNLSGLANDIIYLVNFLRAFGWAEDAAGDTIPQVWESADGVVWNRTPLPLLQDGVNHGSQGSTEASGERVPASGRSVPRERRRVVRTS